MDCHKSEADSPFPVTQQRAEDGMTLVEIAIGAALLGLVAATAIATLMVLNKNAVSTRVMGNAREIVQRNIEAAVGAPFTAISEPPILAVATDAVWDDDGGGDNKETIYANRDGSGAVLGDLTRTVATEANPANADVRRITFRLDYALYNRPMSYQMTTLRAMDK